MNTIMQQFLVELEKLPQDRLEQVLNFVQFLKYKLAKAEPNRQEKSTDELRMSNNE